MQSDTHLASTPEDPAGSPSTIALAGLAASVFLLAFASFVFTHGVGRIAAVWPVNALVVAALLRSPRSSWWRYLAAGLIGIITANLTAGGAPPRALALMVSNGLEILLCAGLMRRFAGREIDLSRQKQLFLFWFVACVAPLASAASCVALTAMAHDMGSASENLFGRWARDAMGLLVVTPTLLVLTSDRLKSMALTLQRGRGWASILSLAASLALVFGQRSYPILFLVPPAMILVAFELDVAGSALALLVTSFVAVMVTLTGHGPAMLVQSGMLARLAVLQVFLVTMTVSVLPVAAALAKRGRLEADLRESNRLATLAQQIAGVGQWRNDLVTGQQTWSDEVFAFHGMRRQDHRPHPHQGIELYEPEDQKRIIDALRRTAATGEPLDLKVRLHRADDGRERVVVFKGEAEHDAAGKARAIFGVMRDVTDEETARSRIEESEARFRLLADSATDLVIRVDADDVIQYVSPSGRRYGYDPESLVGLHGGDFIHPEDLPRVRANLAADEAAGNAKPTFDRSFRVRTADGGYVWMEGNTASIRNETGEIAGLISHMRDISERMAADAALSESEARFRLLADSSTDIVIKVDRNDVIDYVSPSAKRYGYDPQALIGVSGYTLVHPDDLPKLGEIVAELFATGEVDPARDRSYRIRTTAGSYVWMEGIPTIVRDANGAPTAVISQLRDISERRAAIEALADSEMRCRAMADNVSDIISRTGLNGRLTYVSPSITEAMGYTAEALIGQNLVQLMHPEDAESLVAAYQRLVASDQVDHAPVRYRGRHKDGHWVSLECNPTLARDGNGKPIEFIEVTRDVSVQVNLETELRAARDAAEAAVAVKADFLAHMSHEIRTPLTAILGFTSLLAERSDLDASARTQVARVAGAGKSLLSIVNDILDFSKLEAGQFTITPKPSSPAEVLRETLLMFTPQAEAKGLALSFEGGEDLPACLMVDPDRLRQVLLNLIGNAIKFTEEGSVRLAARYAPRTGRLTVKVHDTGPGMSKSQQRKLFQRFSQVDASTTRRHGGTGLGLAICKGLAEAMGGEISVTSRPGQGSVFQVRITAPKAEFAEVHEASDETTALEGLRLLIVDDNPINRELARAILVPFGVEVQEAADGLSAVEAARWTPFDLILMDIRMPGLDGPAATARIRNEDGPNQQIPILAFSADVEMSQYEAGPSDFDGIVRKPIVPADLIMALVKCLQWDAKIVDAAGDAAAA